LSALQAGSDLLILRSPKTLEHVRKYLGSITQKTDMASMGVDLSLSGEPAKEAPKAAAPAKPAEAPKPAPKPVEKPVAPTTPAVEVKPTPVSVPAVKPALVPPRPVQIPSEASTIDVSDDLTDEDIQDLRDMVAAFRAVRSFVSNIGAKLLG
jgi:hypothetical protein